MQAESGPVMQQLYVWMTNQIDDKKIEPGEGGAISYHDKHWEPSTLFPEFKRRLWAITSAHRP